MAVRCWPVVLLALVAGCTGKPATQQPAPLTRLKTDRTYLRDGHGRYVFFHGVNVSGSTKVPLFTEAGGVKTATYVGKPFALAEADAHFAKLQRMGFNSIRLLVMWEGVEPNKKGEYDEAYLDYLREVVKAAGARGLYVLMDMHQDMFSRHLVVKYNSDPPYPKGTLENAINALVPPYNDSVQGDGAPKWAVQACLPEKKMDSPYWGTPRIISGLDKDELENIAKVYQRLTGAPATGELEGWLVNFLGNLPGKFEVDETSDFLPFTHWGVAHGLSLDLARTYACFLAGDKAFPSMKVDGKSVKDHLQEAFAASWGRVAEHVADLPNVMGYDIINEPSGNFLVLTAAAGLIRAGGPDGARSALVSLLGEEQGAEMHRALVALRLLPPDAKPETLAKWGLDKLDLMGVAGLNNGFNENHMRPLFERAGKAILEKDPDAVIFIEHSMSVETFLGGGGLGGQWEVTMRAPEGIPQVVFAPHWYPDIYPFIGFNQPPRSFTAEQVRFREYDTQLETARHAAAYALGNVPVVFGEFGTYFNLNGIKEARKADYEVSAQILDNYFESFERLFQSHMLWCYSPENDYEKGDLWNHEDFSIVDPKQNPRAELAWSRPWPKALAGKPISTHFWSDYHYFDPEKGTPNPRREFEVRYASKETSAPTEIILPEVQYPDGFYVWISDGTCFYDRATATLYHHPSADEPGVEHFVRILPPTYDREATGWRYFFKGDQVIERD